MDSIWTKTVDMQTFPTLEGDVKTDVLIIGGGMAGILCAHFLQEQGVDYVLAEGRTICSGVTKNTTAKITSQHGLIYQKLQKQRGSEVAAMYLNANEEAVTYHTGKLTIPHEYRHIVMNYADICKVTKGWMFVLPTVTVEMRNGKDYTFAVFFGRKRFIDTLVSMGVDG